MNVLYLHGFASSADSSKGRFLAERLGAHGVELQRPDLNLPDFSTITVSRMVAAVEAAMASLPPGPSALIGSSLGALVAWHVAARAERAGRGVARLVLLAPALDFGAHPLPELGEAGMERWRRDGWREFFHHAYNEPRLVHYDLFEDARRHDALAEHVRAPTLVFQGRHDTVVDPEMVVRFAAARPHVTLRLLDDDHQLHASLERIWDETARFLGIQGAGFGDRESGIGNRG
jgi:pimeloyl-ACP methyl ester carboxylesterase